MYYAASPRDQRLRCRHVDGLDVPLVLHALSLPLPLEAYRTLRMMRMLMRPQPVLTSTDTTLGDRVIRKG